MHTVRLFTIFAWWVMKSRSKSDTSLWFSIHSTYSIYFKKINLNNIIKTYLCTCRIFNTRSENKTHCVHCEYCTCISLSVDYCCQTAISRFHKRHNCSKNIISLHMPWCMLASAHYSYKTTVISSFTFWAMIAKIIKNIVVIVIGLLFRKMTPPPY